MECLPRIRSLIAERRSFIVGSSRCPYTKRAVAAAPRGTPVVLLDGFEDSGEALAALKRRFGHPTVPFVFDGGRFVGGSEARL